MPTGATPQERDPEEVARLAVDFLPRREFGAFNKFYDNTLTGNNASISIPVPSWAQTVYYEFLLRSDQAAATIAVNLQPNGSGGAGTYDENYDGVANGVQSQGTATGVAWSTALAATGTGSPSARSFVACRGWIGPCQDTVQDKTIQAMLSAYLTNAYGVNLIGRNDFGFWHPNPAVAISSLLLTPAAGNLVANSILRCWGV